MKSVLILNKNLNILSEIQLNLKTNEDIQSMKFNPNEDTLLISTNENHLYQLTNLVRTNFLFF